MLNYKTPGVFIEEIPAAGPIAGVGSSTVAFIGAAQKGPINVPTKVTNWSQFKDQFGAFITTPRQYLAYAVRGFFDNGGTVAYITRVGTAARASRELDDRGDGKALRVEAHQEGQNGNLMNVAVADAQIVPAGQNARVRRESGTVTTASDFVIKLTQATDAAKFRSGDTVTIESSNERAVVDRVRNDELVLQTRLAGIHTSGIVRVANLAVGQRSFRIENGAGIETGSVLRIAQETGNEDLVVESFVGDFVTLSGTGLTRTYALAANSVVVGLTSYEFRLTITPPQGAAEVFDNLSMDPRHSRYFGRVVRSIHVTVAPSTRPGTAVPPANRPAVLVNSPLTGGANDNVPAIAPSHYDTALAALDKVAEVSLVVAPDRGDTAVQAAVVAHCERKGDRFAILDAPQGVVPFGAGSVITHRAAVESARGHAALYYPWLVVNDAASPSGQTILVPPSGYIAGIFARSDAERGVHKAPANELIRGAAGVERVVDDTEHGELNAAGINVLRMFPGKSRPVVWGARTTAPAEQTPWRYVNVRRLFLFIEEALQDGLRWAVFEPNDLGLWKKLDRTITEFLTRVWRSGALFGATAQEAFYVKIDEELNPPSVRALGHVIIEIGLAPVRPAEFVVARIGMWDGGAEINEA